MSREYQTERTSPARSAPYPGALYLLHASSSSNVAALPSVIRWLKSHGHSFGTVDQLR
jgi:hypothetical protein